MNRLLNALAFAAVVIAVFVTHSNLPQKLACSRLISHVAAHFQARDLPTVAELNVMPPEPPMVASLDVMPPEPPMADRVEIHRIMERTQAVRQALVRAEMRRAMDRARVQVERAPHDCNVVKLDQ